MTYLALKWLHVVGAAVLLGTGIGIAFHFWFASRSRDARTVASAAHAMVVADFAFTLPAVVMQPCTGLALAIVAGYPLSSSWIVASIALYAVAGACWLPVVAIQLRMRKVARAAAAAGGTLGPDYDRLLRRWLALGWPAFASVLAIFALMIARPASLPL